ncbi:FecR family protein [Flagellimonas onchidii]|uniref:FecR family protein n=1 Tax=Flagellimonas onchidii TaxID=2562684 RepID=UPI0010A5CEFF|nr:FecR domain-containing protein [Allomuricauda onchidii]
MTDRKLEILLRNYNRGNLTEKELNLLFEALSDEKNRKNYKQLTEVEYLLSVKYANVDSKKAYQDFLQQKLLQQKRLHTIKRRNAFMKYAAIFLCLIGLGYFVWLNNGMGSSIESKLQIEEHDITLQLENGEIRVIKEDGGSQIVDKQGRILAEQDGYGIVYGDNQNINKLVYNELHVPFGKKFRIELSDGTTVHLNSGSMLKYPVKFIAGNNRDVYIKGEAFFEVAEDKESPFTVHAGDVNVRVLGTSFNVSSYEEDLSVNTVLVSGHVGLYNSSTGYDQVTSFDIQPEQMGIWDKNDKEFTSKKVDAEIYTAWINGKLIFRDLPFRVIRKKLERHYNVSIINSDEVFDENTFSGAFDIESIEEVLETFHRNFGIQYEIIDNKVIIKSKTE